MADDDVLTVETLRAAVKKLKETDGYVITAPFTDTFDYNIYFSDTTPDTWGGWATPGELKARHERRLFKSFGKRKPHVRNAHPWWGYPLD